MNDIDVIVTTVPHCSAFDHLPTSTIDPHLTDLDRLAASLHQLVLYCGELVPDESDQHLPLEAAVDEQSLVDAPIVREALAPGVAPR